MALYSAPGFVSYDAIPVLQAQTISMNVETDNKDVMTLLLGNAGFSAGAKKVQISVSNALPAAGMEQAWITIANAQGEVSLTFTIAGTAYNCRGDIRSVKVDTSTDKANDVSFEFHGRLVNEVPAA